MGAPLCDLCNAPMTKTKTLNSGNSRFETYSCKTCNIQRTICTGVTSQES